MFHNLYTPADHQSSELEIFNYLMTKFSIFDTDKKIFKKLKHILPILDLFLDL